MVTNGFMTRLRSQWRPLSSRRGDGGGEGGGEAHLSNVECRLSPRKDHNDPGEREKNTGEKDSRVENRRSMLTF